MKKRILLSFLILTAVLICSISYAQEKEKADTKKLYSEIAGNYELNIGTRMLPFEIILKEGTLLFDAKVPGLDPEKMIPVKDKELTFESIDPNGNEVSFKFTKNEKGKITGCTVYIPAMNAEAEAVKLEKTEKDKEG